MFVAPSVTPWRYVTATGASPVHNPGIRLVTYDRTNGKHIDLEQFYLDLEAANNNSVAEWKSEYRTGRVYNLSDLSAVSLAGLVQRMENPSNEEFTKYVTFYTVSAPEAQRVPCDDSCHASVLCGFTNFYMKSFETCMANFYSRFLETTNAATTSGAHEIVSSMFDGSTGNTGTQSAAGRTTASSSGASDSSG